MGKAPLQGLKKKSLLPVVVRRGLEVDTRKTCSVQGMLRSRSDRDAYLDGIELRVLGESRGRGGRAIASLTRLLSWYDHRFGMILFTLAAAILQVLEAPLNDDIAPHD